MDNRNVMRTKEKPSYVDVVASGNRCTSEYLDEVRESDFGKYKEIAFDLLSVNEGQQILDVGCGNGDEALLLSKKVGEEGKVIGIDNCESMYSESQKRAKGLNLPVEFMLMDIMNMSFDDNAFDACIADRVFHWLSDPQSALKAIIKVVKNEGAIVACNADPASFVLDIGNKDLSRKVINEFIDNRSRHGITGGQLSNLFKKVGLTEITHSPFAYCWTDFNICNKITPLKSIAKGALHSGKLTEAEYAQFNEDLSDAVQNNMFTFITTMVIIKAKVFK